MKRSNVLRSLTVLFILSLTVWGFCPSEAKGVVPQLINFQGVLKDGSGNPVADASYSVTFTIYDAAIGGNNLWTETQPVTTSNGLFTVLLGSTTPLPDSVFYDSSRYLGMAVSPDAEMTPRQRLSSVGYSYVSSQWTSAGQNLFRLNGNVGIGESNPLNTLTIGSNGAWTSTGLFPGILMGTTSFQTKQLLIGRDENNFVQLAYDDDDPISSARLLVEGNHPLYITTGGSLVLATQTTNPLELYTNSTARMHITADGNVGIGTTSPGAPLSFANTLGDKVFIWNGGVNDQYGIGLQSLLLQIFTGGAASAIAFGHGNSGSFTELMRINGNGTVGIGTTSPAQKFHVFSSGTNVGIAVDGGSGGRARLGLLPGGVDNGELGFKNDLQIGTVSDASLVMTSEKMRITNAGNVGIGTTAPTEKLHVVGNICATGTIGACSDARFKRNIRPVDGSLDKIEKLQGVTYRWNREEYPQFAEGNQIGFVAQEVKEILPEVVSEGSDGTLSVDYGRFSVVLLEAIKEQQKEIKGLKEAIEKLQAVRR